MQRLMLMVAGIIGTLAGCASTDNKDGEAPGADHPPQATTKPETAPALKPPQPKRAGWVKYAETHASTHYFAPDSINVNGHLRTVLDIQNRKKRDPKGFISIFTMVEFDCLKSQVRPLSTGAYSEPMASGRLLFAGSIPGNWLYIPPGVVYHDLLKIVCAVGAEAAPPTVPFGRPPYDPDYQPSPL